MHIIVYGAALTVTVEEAQVEFLNSSKLEILNQGNGPTFCSGSRLEAMNITLGSFGLPESIGWEVSSEHSLSDHRHILFTSQGCIPVCLIRNTRGKNWGSFRGDLKYRLEKGPEMNMKNEAGLGLAIHWVQQALI
jgi:hypothetical protein